MKTTFLGDIHGDVSLLQGIPSNTIQLGDLNLHGYQDWFNFHNNDDDNIVVNHTFRRRMFFIDGNHDNFHCLNPNASEVTEVVPNLYYIPRGFVSGRVLFVGGGSSIDADRRTFGYDHNCDEEVSQRQIYKVLAIDSPIEVIVSHDVPVSYWSKSFEYPTAIALQSLLDHFKPKVWVHGHLHRAIEKVVGNCHFIGLGIGCKREVDVPLGENLLALQE